jgi:mannose-6-phosphate isomerase-like protein (cupin superfamily)
MSTTYLRGAKDTRPWGTWEVLDGGEHFCVKKICVLPHSQLSLQLHHYRNEHWIIVSGEAVVTLGDNKKAVRTDESVYIPVNTKHRIENTTDTPMEFIEIQTGERLEESDIVRFEDIYGRI